jgi:hypothetical protein
MSSPINTSGDIYNDDTQSDDSTLPYEAVNNAEPPVNHAPTEEPLSVEELQWMERLDHCVTSRMIEMSQELHHIQNLNECDAKWTDFAIETAEIIDQIEFRRPLTVREMYYNIMKKKRINLAAINYNCVVETLKNTHQGPPKDNHYFKQLTYYHQMDYLSLPIWENIRNCDKMTDINPFLLMER